MFQNCTIQMLMDQQNIIHKQRETIEKKKTSTKKVKTKTTEELETKHKQLNKLKKPKNVSKSFALCAKTRHLTEQSNKL